MVETLSPENAASAGQHQQAVARNTMIDSSSERTAALQDAAHRKVERAGEEQDPPIAWAERRGIGMRRRGRTDAGEADHRFRLDIDVSSTYVALLLKEHRDDASSRSRFMVEVSPNAAFFWREFAGPFLLLLALR